MMEFQWLRADYEKSSTTKMASDDLLAPSEGISDEYISETLFEEFLPDIERVMPLELGELDAFGGTPVSAEVPQINCIPAEPSKGGSSKAKSPTAKKLRGVAKKKVKGESGKLRGRPPKKSASKTTETVKKTQTRASRKYVPEAEKDEEYARLRAKNNRAARRSRAKKKYLEAIHGDSWSDLFDATDMTDAQTAVLENVRTKVGLLMCQVWDIAEEQARKEYQSQ